MTSPYAINLLTDTFNRSTGTIGPASAGTGGSALYDDTDSVYSANNALICSGSNGGYASFGHALTWKNYGSNQLLNQEVYLDILDLTPILTGNASFTIGLRVGDGGQTFYGWTIQKSDTSHISSVGVTYQLNTRPGYSAPTVAVSAGHAYRFHMYAYWDEVSQQTRTFTEIVDINALGIATPFGSGTQIATAGGLNATAPPTWPTHKTPTAIAGSFCPADGNCGIVLYCNPNSYSGGMQFNQLVINDPVGLNNTIASAYAPSNQSRVYSFPGPVGGYSRNNGASSVSASQVNTICRGEFFAPGDMDSIVMGMAGLLEIDDSGATGPNRKCRNAITWLGSIEVPSMAPNTPFGVNAQSDQLTDTGQIIPLYNAQGKRSLVVQPGDIGYLKASLPARIPAGQRVFWRLQALVPAGGELPYGSPYGDDPEYISSISALTVPSVKVFGAYTGSGSLTGTVYVSATVNNDPYGESQAATEVAVACGSTAISGSGANVSYSTSYTGNGTNGTMTDTTSNQFANLAIGSQLTVSGHTYTIIANNGSGVLTISGNWTGGTPANGTAYSIQCDTLTVAVSNTNGVQAVKWYAGTSSGNSNLFPLTDTNGVDPNQPYTFAAVTGSGSNPPSSGTIYPDLTVATIAPQNWSLAGGGNIWYSPWWIGGQVAPAPALAVLCEGTSIDQGTGDFGTTAGGTGHTTNSNSSGGWFDRAFRCSSGSRNLGIVAVNLARSGGKLVSDLSDSYQRSNSVHAILAKSCNTVLISHYTNDSAPLQIMQAVLLQKISQYKAAGCQVLVVDTPPRVTSYAGNSGTTPPGFFTSIADQVLANPGVYPTAGTKSQLWNAWLQSLVTAGTIAGYLPLFATIKDAASGKWGVINAGTPYYDPVTYALMTWTDITGTFTSAPNNTTAVDTSQSWTTNQFYNNGAYMVVCPTGGTGGGKTAAKISANTSNTLTLDTAQNSGSVSWTNGTPASGATYHIYPVMTADGVHPAPHGHAQMAVAAQTYLPAMKAGVVQLIANGPIITSRGRN